MATRSASTLSLRIDSLTPLHWIGVVLALVTGVIHLVLGVAFVTEPLGWAFLVAGVGYLGGVAAVLVDYRRRLMYLLGIPFTAGQIVAWYVVNAPDFSPLGVGDKLVQVALIGALAVLYVRSS
jgi:hypothetical protein